MTQQPFRGNYHAGSINKVLPYIDVHERVHWDDIILMLPDPKEGTSMGFKVYLMWAWQGLCWLNCVH